MTVAIFVAAYLLPENVPAIVFTIGSLIGVRQYAEVKQKALLADFLENGATHHSGWRAFGVSLLCVLVVFLVIVAVVLVALLLNPDLVID